MTAEHRLKELGIALPAPPEPFGTYAEAVQTSNLLFLTGMLPTQGRGAAFIGRVGAELDVDTARKAARLAALNVRRSRVTTSISRQSDAHVRPASWWRRRETSAISRRRSPTALQTCCRTCSKGQNPTRGLRRCEPAARDARRTRGH
jgi:hypothetical protein